MIFFFEDQYYCDFYLNNSLYKIKMTGISVEVTIDEQTGISIIKQLYADRGNDLSYEDCRHVFYYIKSLGLDNFDPANIPADMDPNIVKAIYRMDSDVKAWIKRKQLRDLMKFTIRHKKYERSSLGF